MKNEDWNKIMTDFEKLEKKLATPKVIQQLQKEGIVTPRIYIKTIITLEEFAKKSENTKKNAKNAKSFNAAKQKLKKLQKQYQKEIEDYSKVTSDAEVVEEKEESESSKEWDPDADSSEGEEPAAVPPKVTIAEPEDSDKDSASEQSDDDSGSEDDKQGKAKPNRWFTPSDKKNPGVDSSPVPAPPKKPKQPRKDKPTKVETKEEKPTEMTPEQLKLKLKEILTGRGKRNTDPLKQVEKLQELVPYAKDSSMQIDILTQLVSSQFDCNRSVATHLSITLWKAALQNLLSIVSFFEKNPNLLASEENVKEEEEVEEEGEEEAEQRLVSGNLVAFIQRLDEEFNKSLQSIDPHTQEYVQRLGDENSFLELAERAQNCYEKVGALKSAARIAARRVEHIYYKLDAHHARAVGAAVEPKATEEGKTEILELKALSQLTISAVDNKELLDRLSNLIYSNGDERMKIRTMLCHIYYHAIHDRFYEARDMMLMSHLQETIGNTDITTQILFNRTMVQLGLCAFRNNLIKQAHSCLTEIYAGGRVKELLAQGVTSSTRYNDKTQEQEKQERKRQLPYHMHINLELLEAIHLITALLLEVPNMAANQYDVKKKVISRTFRRLLDYFDRSVFSGPPENTREIIITAAKSLSKGDWKRCEELLLNLPVWNLVNKSDQVKAMVRRKIQEEGLRTYIFTYASVYDSMSMEHLAKMFELSKNTVHSIVSKMMISDELHASWDQPTGAIVMHKVEPTRLQFLAQQFAEKAATFVENNERLLDSRMGNYGYKYDPKQQKDRWQERNDRDGRQRDNKNFQYQKKDSNRGNYSNFQQQRNRPENRSRGGLYNNRDDFK
eukprot:TRINITY_DN7921_c0_g1_i2.p1 TRINITY_DN7921_c0_g1~~TRINITY_DN7921_c0_g1_i2.p1  ORF type:complete len:930 (+),score=337.49 TRINITY_DN7921_c0_g1_i2:271-2790(+)